MGKSPRDTTHGRPVAREPARDPQAPGEQTPADLAARLARRRSARGGQAADDGFVRETFRQPRDEARRTARAFLDRYPAAAYMSAVEHWRELPDGAIEFTMRRLRTAD
jgi:hypothetical protein